MAFCTHCGAKLPDGARFCTTCGNPVAAAPSRPSRPSAAPRATTTPQGGIIIDAPEGSTVTISDSRPGPVRPQAPAPDITEAPSTQGEFTLVSWDEPGQPERQSGARRKPAAQGPSRQAPARSRQAFYGSGKKSAAPAAEKKKKKGIKWYLWVLIAIGTYLLLTLFPPS